METVYEVVFDRCGTATTKRATFIPKHSHSDFSYSEREIIPCERRQSSETNDRRSCHGVNNTCVTLDLRSSRGRRYSDYVRHTLHVSV